MIRVNLLPRRREAKREGSKAWVAVLIAAALLEIVGIVVVHAGKKKELDDQLESNRAIEASIADKKAKVANHEAVKKQLAEYQAREDAIAKLQSGRTGPTAMMLELSRMLTPRKLPSIDADALEKLRRENPGAVPSEKWDPHRLWLIEFKEIDRAVTIKGFGKTNDDVAEFLRRVTVSKFFTDVRLVRTEEKMEKDQALGVTYSTTVFELKAKVKY
ncbi:MAG: PilN domain-containing protein [Deltaproteobacteria bacterium]|nr:PilN domain-containing protein [Deltaproteobacteria bacterium]